LNPLNECFHYTMVALTCGDFLLQISYKEQSANFEYISIVADILEISASNKLVTKSRTS
jgi:hypothetical protein